MSNTGTRVLVAALAIPGIVLMAWLGGYFWALLIAVLIVGVLMEFSAMAHAKGAEPQTAVMIVTGILLLAVFLNERLSYDIPALTGLTMPWPLQWQAFLWIALLFGMTAPLVELFRNRGSALRNLGLTFLGTYYIALFLASAAGIREIFTVAEFPVGPVFGTAELNAVQLSSMNVWGAGTVIAMLAAIWICDTAAYFGGRAMGRHKLFPRVSPNKTWEGAIWGFAGAVLTMVAAKFLLLEYLSLTHAVILGALVGVLDQLGDLVESLLKRDAGIKDSSALLPGHGGLFDRFDSLIFVSPAVFLYLDFIVFAR